ncbi:hypothetical protein PILCRDRAFT_16798 [Piloderma croceum F 1598]|uniref:Uncharacterized protein n=1 Tax=Piloderma croceum (strain F 1598) TaxID=765440 RepID=A0A0C3EUJ6_PILCF|nr:hypothetical protein PILCRDRAFT_16798 [Piloderma croceum F 1598]
MGARLVHAVYPTWKLLKVSILFFLFMCTWADCDPSPSPLVCKPAFNKCTFSPQHKKVNSAIT